MNIYGYQSHPFAKFDKEWGLLTAGIAGDFNSMTISWGGMGTMWRKPVLFLVVKPTRHTFGFVSRHDELTVSFYEEKYRKALALFGSMSGRDIDKPSGAGLTPSPIKGGMTYAEAKETIVCRKLFLQQMDKAQLPGFALQFYQGEKESHAHYLVIAEVESIIE